MKKQLKIFIADDHTLFRKAMVNLIKTFENVAEVKDAENGKELLTLMKYQQPDVAIVDLQMPVMDGTETCENIFSKYPEVKVIVLTMHDSEKYILHMMEMGVHAFLLKNTEPEELEHAINAVIEKDFYHNDLVASVLRKNLRDKKQGHRPTFATFELSEREKEIVMLVCQEMTIKEIGQKLNLSENTVRNHRTNIMEKVGVNNMVGLVKYAYDTGLVK
ncbi:MAG TPA: response regulator transcription factor [Chryseosolibacter sp.]